MSLGALGDQYFLQGPPQVPSTVFFMSAHRKVWGFVVTTRHAEQPVGHVGWASSQTSTPEKDLQLSQQVGK
jgi:hypothetical protein